MVPPRVVPSLGEVVCVVSEEEEGGVRREMGDIRLWRSSTWSGVSLALNLIFAFVAVGGREILCSMFCVLCSML